MLLTGAGLMMRSLAHLRSLNPGFVAHNVLTFSLPIPSTRYKTPEEEFSFLETITDQDRGAAGR